MLSSLLAWANDPPKPAAAPENKVEGPVPITDTDARGLRDLQLAMSELRRTIAEARASILDASTTLDKLAPQLDAKVAELRSKYHCPDCKLDGALNWVKPKADATKVVR